MESNWGFFNPHLLYAELAVLLVAISMRWGRWQRLKRLQVLLSPEEIERFERLFRQRRRANLLFLAGLACAIVGAAGPFWGQRTAAVESAGVNVIAVVDLSASMNARDYHPSRLEVARLELGRLLERLKGQRVGLVGFAGIPVTLLPLTVDYTAAQMALDSLSTAAIPVPGTAIGDGIRVAIERLGRAGGVLVLLSDGEDYHSEPFKAAQAAAKRGIPIVCVGIGTEQGSTVPNGEGENNSELRDDKGQIVTSRLDTATLEEIARLTRGRYFRLQAGSDRNIEAIMSVVYACNAREQMRQEAKVLRDGSAYWFCFALALLLSAIALYARAGQNGRESEAS